MFSCTHVCAYRSSSGVKYFVPDAELAVRGATENQNTVYGGEAKTPVQVVTGTYYKCTLHKYVHNVCHSIKWCTMQK